MNVDLSNIPALSAGSHEKVEQGACVMEAVSYVAGEPWSDHPACACPVIGSFLRSWNDALPDDERDDLLRDLIPKLVGTRSTAAVEQRRAMLAADWLIRTHTPAWLRLADLALQADTLSALPEITDMAQCPSLMLPLEAVRHDAAAAGAAARAAAWDAARAAAGAAAGAAAWAAAWDAARDAAGAAARAAAWAAARAAAWDAAWDAARDAARDAAGDNLANTRKELQTSALQLVHRMIAVTEIAA